MGAFPAPMHTQFCLLVALILLGSPYLSMISWVKAEDPTQSYDWVVTYKWLQPLGGGIPQKVIAINDQFPGPTLSTVTNHVGFINVYNYLDEPFLLHWNGIQMRKNAWQDGTQGTNCPILPGRNWTYVIQFKDQIGSFFYAPSLLYQKAAGGYGGISIANRIIISVPFAPPTDEFTVLIGDWYRRNHTDLRHTLENGSFLPKPDGVLINGQQAGVTNFGVQAGNTYRFRVCNVGTSISLNFRIGSHSMLLVEVEGTYTQQTYYNSLDIHVGQCLSVLVTMNQSPGTYYIVASPRFVDNLPDGSAVLQYQNSPTGSTIATPYPSGPSTWDYQFSIDQAKSIKTNLTTGAARPNPQGSYHYKDIPIQKSVILANSAPVVGGHQRCAVGGNSFVYPDTPLLLADYFNISGVFKITPFQKRPVNGPYVVSTFVGYSGLKTNMTEFTFQNNEDTLQTWHLDGYSFFVVGMGQGNWTKASRKQYNWQDAISRSTTQVYPRSWTSVLVQLDNKGMWNLRSQELQRQTLGQELYLRVWAPPAGPFGDENQKPIPSNVILCGKAVNYQP